MEINKTKHLTNMSNYSFKYYVHGHPKAFEYHGEASEKDYFQHKYFAGVFSGEHNNGTEQYAEFRIHSRAIGGSNYYYYSLFDNYGIVGTDGRRGYIALTVSMNVYCKRARLLMNLLEVFLQNEVAPILMDESGRKFRSDNFTGDIGRRLDNILNGVLKITLEQVLSDSDFCKLTTRANGRAKRLNTSDANDSAIIEALKQHGEVSISDNHPSASILQMQNTHEISIREEKERLRRISEEKENKLQARINELSEEIKAGKTKQNKSAQKINELQDRLKQIRAIVEDIEIGGVGGNRDNDGASLRGRLDPTPPPVKRRLSKWWIIVFIVLFLLICYVIKTCSSKEEPTEQVTQTESISYTSLSEQYEIKIENVSDSILKKGHTYYGKLETVNYSDSLSSFVIKASQPNIAEVDSTGDCSFKLKTKSSGELTLIAVAGEDTISKTYIVK